MKSEHQIKRHVKKIRIKPDAAVDKRVLARAEAALAKSTKKPDAGNERHPSTWRIIMRSPIIKLAVAAVIIIAVLICIYQLGGSTPAFADIVRPLLAAHTATFKMTYDMEDQSAQTIHGMFMEPSRMRQEMSSGHIFITDQQQGITVTLMPDEKKAIIMEVENLPEEEKGKVNMFHTIRDMISQADDESVEFIGKQKVDGVNAIGYRIEHPLMEMTVWADAKILLPVKIEYSMGKLMGTEGTIAMSDIVFDIELDESLFEVPDGYSTYTVQYDASMPEEGDFIQSLRIWSEVTGGKFPSELNMKALMSEFFKVQMEKMGFDVKQTPDTSDPKFQEFMQTYTKVTRGITFAIRLSPESDWNYAGKDAKFGDANMPIFWYRPKDSDAYRVIYGDLTVKDLTPEDLPK